MKEAYYRPGATVGVAPYRYWHFTNDQSLQNYTNSHGDKNKNEGGGNVAFADGHVEFRNVTKMRSGDYGLTHGTDDISASNSITYQLTTEL